MSNQKSPNPKRFKPTHIGTQGRGFGGNKGKQMQDTSGKHAQVIQTKGE
jgi:small acid-soluble spore protein N (minor)